MRFRLSATITVPDRETGDEKPFDEWTDKDYDYAHERLWDRFYESINVPFDPVATGNDHITQHDETTGYNEMLIEVDDAFVAEAVGLDVFSGVITPTDDVEVESRSHHDKMYVEGRMYGDPNQMKAVEGKVFRACKVEPAEFRSIVEEDYGQQVWHEFIAEFNYGDLLSEMSTQEEMAHSILTNGATIGIQSE